MRRQIVFWLPQGRLGNLMFQYQAAISLFPENGTIISLKSEFSETFDHVPFVKFIPLPKVLIPRVTLYWANLFRWCVKKNILGSIKPKWDVVENYPIETMEICKTSGWFSMFWVIDGFFQHEHYAVPSPILKVTFVERAEKLLQQIPLERRVAVHLRFGDYDKWPVFGKQGACLPSSYYQNAMRNLVQRVSNPVFVIFSDDRKRAEEVIGDNFEKIYFEGGSSGTDIAGISLCNHAIISASTFSWWGAYLIKNSERIVVAPKYWAGFKSRIWYPVDIQTNCFEYIDVAKCEQS